MKNINTTECSYAIGLDLGGTNAVFGIVDKDGIIIKQTSIKTQDYVTVEAFVDASVIALMAIVDEVGGISNIKAMGIGAPNANYYTGSIEMAPNLIWAKDKVVPLAKVFEERLGIKVTMTNDANAAAIGEMTFGVAKGLKNFIVITLGTGVGSGIVINGELVYGHDGNAGELGHVTVDRSEDARLCGCGRRGCLEAYASATGVARTAREIVAKSERPTMLKAIDPSNIDSYEVYKAAIAGDDVAKEIFEFTGKILGEACADFTVFSSPEAFVFFGGLTKSGEMIMEPIRRYYENHVMKNFKGKAKFLFSSLEGAGAAVLGAAALGWNN